MSITTGAGRLWVLASASLCLFSTGCGEDETLALAPRVHHVTIRQTSYGIPHLLADDVPSVTAGLGYVGARDYGCILLDQIVRVRSERAQYFGPGNSDANLDSDFAMLTLDVHAAGERGLAKQTSELRAAIDAYVTGFNYAVSQGKLPALCAGAAWATRPLTAADLFAYYYWLAQLGSADPLLSMIATAAPPSSAPAAQAASATLPKFEDFTHGSNGWAIGREKSESGRGMLLANPHFPWEGNRRFYESHITVPGLVNVYGASLLGAPVINIGFNEHVAWTHTVSTAHHFTLYRLTLAPNDPSSYLYDGAPRAMVAKDFSVQVLGTDGALTSVSRRMYHSHYGPMLNVAALGGWSKDTSFTFRNANEDNFALGEQWYRMNQAKSLDDLKRVNQEVQGIPWVNTMAVDAAGTALYMDASRTPNLSPATEQRLRDALANDALTRIVNTQGATLLDGSDSRNEWQPSDAPTSGIVPFSRSPQQERQDFVFNANDSYWLTNPLAPLTGYSVLFGEENTPRSPRTRMNMMYLTEARADGSSGADGKFSFDELTKVEFSDRASLAEVLLEQVVARCQGGGPVTSDGQSVDISGACAVLSAWDRRLTLNSVGAVLWREFLASFSGNTSDKGLLFEDAFDPRNPVTTPHTLVAAPPGGIDPVRVALAHAVIVLKAAGLEPNARLGDVQHTKKNDQVIPIHGGTNLEGGFNIVGYNGDSGTLLPSLRRGKVLSPPTGLTGDGYWINNGSSFMLALEYTDEGPHAEAVLSYSESADPSSPHFTDQTLSFSDSKYRPVLFTESEIASDPNLEVIELDVPKE